MQVQQNKTPGNSAGSDPSDKNKDVRWMGHSFVSISGRKRRCGGLLQSICSNASSTKQNARKFHGHSHPSDKTKTSDGWGTVSSSHLGSETPVRDCYKHRRLEFFQQVLSSQLSAFSGLPPSDKTKTSDGWGTVSSPISGRKRRCGTVTKHRRLEFFNRFLALSFQPSADSHPSDKNKDVR